MNSGRVEKRKISSASSLLSIEVFTKSQFIVCGLVLLLIPLFEPESLGQLMGAGISNLYNIGKVLSVCLIVMLLVFSKSRLTLLSVLSFLLTVVVLISTVVDRNGYIKEWIVEWIPFLSIILLAQCCAARYQREFLVALLIVTGALSILNCLSVLLHPEGLYSTLKSPLSDNFFWGNRNTAYEIVVPSVLISLILDKLNKSQMTIRTLLFLVLGFLQITVAFSATSLLALFAFICLLLVTSMFSISKRMLNSISIGIAYVGCTVLLVVFRIQEAAADLLSGLTGRNLSRSATLSGRTDIWDVVFSLMEDASHSLMGYGATSNQYLIVPWSYQSPFAHAHNEFLNTWLCGGWIGLVLYIAIIICSLSALSKAKDAAVWAPIVSAFIAYLVIGLTETTLSPSLGVILSISFYIGYITNIARRIEDNH